MQTIPVNQPLVIKGKEVFTFRLANKNNTSVSITNYGAIISSFIVRHPDGSFNNIVLGFEEPSGYSTAEYLKNYPYFGAAIGRYGNRIGKGKIKIDDTDYQLSTNIGPDHLHGGREGFDKKVWDLVSFDEPLNRLELKLTSPDGEENYPGTLEVHIVFQLTDDDELNYTYHAVTDKPTAVNLTHHSYFNLNNGQGDIRDHFLKINAGEILEQDSNLTTTGKYIPVENTKYDFRDFHRIAERLKHQEGYDQSFVITKNEAEFVLAAEAYSAGSKLKLQVYTDQPVVHCYTGEGIADMAGRNGSRYKAFSGLCLETQIHPNAINVSSFPDTILRPGRTYRHKTAYRIVHI